LIYTHSIARAEQGKSSELLENLDCAYQLHTQGYLDKVRGHFNSLEIFNESKKYLRNLPSDLKIILP
jgi:hypothetical protein